MMQEAYPGVAGDSRGVCGAVAWDLQPRIESVTLSYGGRSALARFAGEVDVANVNARTWTVSLDGVDFTACPAVHVVPWEDGVIMGLLVALPYRVPVGTGRLRTFTAGHIEEWLI